MWKVQLQRIGELWEGWEGCTGDHLVATSNLSFTRLTLQAPAPCFFLSVSQSSDVSKRGTGGFLEPKLWPRAGVRHRGGNRDSFSALPSDPLPFPHPEVPSLTCRAQDYPRELLGSTALSSGLDDGHGHLWRKGHSILFGSD